MRALRRSWRGLCWGVRRSSPIPPPGAIIWFAALNEANTAGEWDEAAWPAAVALGNWALGAEKYDIAATAWTAADIHSDASLVDPVLAHAVAKTGQAATLILPHVNRPDSSALAQARELLSDAQSHLYPFAVQERSDHQLTPAQAAYAQAMAWLAFTHVDYERPHGPRAEHDWPDAHDASGAVGLPCEMGQSAGDAGSVSDGGRCRRGEAASSSCARSWTKAGKLFAPTKPPPRRRGIFTSAALQMTQRYHVVRFDDAPANCVMPHVASCRSISAPCVDKRKGRGGEPLRVLGPPKVLLFGARSEFALAHATI